MAIFQMKAENNGLVKFNMHEIQSQAIPQVDFNTVKCVQGFNRIQMEYSAYLTDESRLSTGPFDFLFFPKTEAELAAVISEMKKRNVCVTIAGARTGLVGGAVPVEGALVSLEYLDQVEKIYCETDTQEWRVCAQTSVSLKDLETMLRAKHIPVLEQNTELEVQKEYEKFKNLADNYFYPPDPTEMSASLGGSVVTNASGARTYRYGPTRAWVRGLRVLLAEGEDLDVTRGQVFAYPVGLFAILNSNGTVSTITIPDYSQPDTKCTTGLYSAPQMDLIDLFIGSEGILGIVTRVEVALLKQEEKVSIIQFLDSDEQAVFLAEALRSDSRIQLDFLEFYSGNALNLLRELQQTEPSVVGMPMVPENANAALFFEMHFDSQAVNPEYTAFESVLVSCGADSKRSWAGYERRELDRFKVFRHLVPETINSRLAERKKLYPGIHKLGTDMAVPNGHLQEMWQLYKTYCEQLKLEWYAFGHIGNNHIHVNILPRDMQELEQGMQLYEIFARKAVELGGTFSAEHGIGKIKTKFMPLMFTPEQIAQMRRVKQVLDPQSLLNPGDILPVEAHL